MTLKVEPVTRSMAKNDEISDSTSLSDGEPTPLKRVKNRATSDVDDMSTQPLGRPRERQPAFIGGMASFGGGKGWDW